MLSRAETVGELLLRERRHNAIALSPTVLVCLLGQREIFLSSTADELACFGELVALEAGILVW